MARSPMLSPVAPTATAPAVHAAGAVVWRRAAAGGRGAGSGRRGGIEVLLVHRPSYDDWSFPKGKVEHGETLPECAVREIQEETGVGVVLGQRLPAVRYRLDDGRLKVCHYWAAHVVEADSPALRARIGVEPCSPKEVDRAVWVAAPEARKLLSRASDRAPLDALTDLWDEGTLETKAFVVLRHARAKKRSAWDGGEADRPLTAQGLRHAANLTGTLAAFGVERIASSPWARCVQTVAPYAELSEVPIELFPQTTESAAKAKPKVAERTFWLLLTDLRVSSRNKQGEPSTVVCSHRPVLPLLLKVIAERSPNRVVELLPRVNPFLRTGEMLVAHVLPRHRRGARVIAVERYRAPQ